MIYTGKYLLNTRKGICRTYFRAKMLCCVARFTSIYKVNSYYDAQVCRVCRNHWTVYNHWVEFSLIATNHRDNMASSSWLKRSVQVSANFTSHDTADTTSSTDYKCIPYGLQFLQYFHQISINRYKKRQRNQLLIFTYFVVFNIFTEFDIMIRIECSYFFNIGQYKCHS